MEATRNGNTFTATVTPPNLGKSFYYRAFATNQVGESHGRGKRLVLPEHDETVPWWSHAEETEAGWRVSAWFGAFLPLQGGWIYHSDLGWVYTVDDGAGNLWLWREGQGWLWTGQGIYRYLYRHQDQSWIYFLARKNGHPHFYNCTTKKVD